MAMAMAMAMAMGESEDKMEWYSILALCFLCFAVGWFGCSLCVLGRAEMPDPPEHVAGVGTCGKGA